MSTENTPDETDDISLDDFAAEFNGQSPAVPDTTKPEADEELEDSDDAQNDEAQDDNDTDIDDTDDGDATDNEDEDEEEQEEAPKPKKNRFQERIDELTTARREAEREAQALKDRLAAIEGRLNPDTNTPSTASKAQDEGTKPPTPMDTNEDGTEKYPLGEFDPAFISDLTKFNVDKAFAEREQRARQEQEQAKRQEQMGQLEAEWNTQLDSARERYPDFEDRASALAPMFSDVDEAYGEYLGATLMSMEKGADVLYYLANHPEEAKAIVDSGAQKATIALGRIEARFANEDSGTPTPRVKISNAPKPPPQTRGSSTARGRVAPDTDDLDAFAAEFNRK